MQCTLFSSNSQSILVYSVEIFSLNTLCTDTTLLCVSKSSWEGVSQELGCLHLLASFPDSSDKTMNTSMANIVNAVHVDVCPSVLNYGDPFILLRKFRNTVERASTDLLIVISMEWFMS